MVSNPLQPNDRVRVLVDLYDFLSSILTVTAGSLGRIISFAEYCDYIKRRFEGKDTEAGRAEHFSKVAKTIQDNKAFIVMIEEFAALSEAEIQAGSTPRLLEDVLVILPEYLEKVE